ncbi:MAG: hypothetical protein GX567_12165, partial [Clostridia bacterium]|nr:hypothetical protein [Clostridia bacterium]
MAKMRVHELAKEINVTSKDVIAVLQQQGTECVAASSISDDQIAFVKSKIGKTDHNTNNKSADAPVKAEEKAEAPKKKKSNIIFVSNPHNSRVPGGQRPMNNKTGGQRPMNNQTMAPKPGIIKSSVPTTAKQEMAAENNEQSASVNQNKHTDTSAATQSNHTEVTPNRTGVTSNENAQTKTGENAQTGQNRVQNNYNSNGNRDSSNRSYGRNDSGPRSEVNRSQGSYNNNRPAG